MRYDLTISTTYVEDWGIWEGAREVLQNAKDEEDKNGHKMTIEYNESRQILKVKNDGAFLNRSAMLIGLSDKKGDNSLRGMHGEGLKLGTIALLRCGIGVKIRNNKELWAPFFNKLRKFNSEKILSFKVTKHRGADCKGVVVEISGLKKDDWEIIKDRALFINKPSDYKETTFGSILNDEKYRGKVFVKDLFVSDYEGYQHGYNLTNLRTDRDRRMVSTFDLTWELARIWEKVSENSDRLSEKTFTMLSKGDNDVDGFRHIYTSTSFKDKMCDHFTNVHGGDAFPVINQDESDSMSHIGKKGIIVPTALHGILGHRFDSSAKESLKSEVKKEYREIDLSDDAKDNLKWVKNLISLADSVFQELINPWITIVDFYDDNIYGKFSLKEKRIFISRKAVSSRKRLLNAIVEEIAHMTLKSHGHNDFKMAIHDIYSLIILNSGM